MVLPFSFMTMNALRSHDQITSLFHLRKGPLGINYFEIKVSTAPFKNIIGTSSQQIIHHN